MSLVVAIKDKDRIVLGADKQASTGGTKDHTNTKIWKLEELPGAIIGSVGSARASQVIQYSQIIDKNLITLFFIYIVLIVKKIYFAERTTRKPILAEKLESTLSGKACTIAPPAPLLQLPP
jgi:hypothetical protein